MPALLAAVLAMFSLEDRPRPLPQGLAADVLFDGRAGRGTCGGRSPRRTPTAAPGRPGDRATADTVERTLAARGFSVERDRFTHDGRDLVNVVGRRAGRTRRLDRGGGRPRRGRDAGRHRQRLRHRGAARAGARASRGAPRARRWCWPRSTARRWARWGPPGWRTSSARRRWWTRWWSSPAWARPPAVGSFLQAWSNDTRRAGIGLQRTVADSIRAGAGPVPGVERRLRPAGAALLPDRHRRAGSVLLEHGFDAVRISGSGELPPEGSGPVAAVRRGPPGHARPGDAAHASRPWTRADARSTGPTATCWP